MRNHLHAVGSTEPQTEALALRRALRPRGPVHLALTKRLHRGATVVEVGGELDVLTTARLGAELDQIVRRQAGEVIIDLRSTGFIDSAGLHLLLTAQRRLSRQKRSIAVVCAPGPVRRVIERARVHHTLRVVASLEELEAVD